MSFLDCISQNPALTPAQIKKLTNEYNDLFSTYRKTMGDDVAAAAAAEKYVATQEKIIAKKNENAIRDIMAWQGRVNPKLTDAANKYSADKKQAGRLGLLWGGSAEAGAIRGMLEDTMIRRNSLERRFTTSIGELIEKYRSKFAGVKQDTEGFRSVVADILNGKANPEARAISEVFEIARKMYEQAGGIIGKVENYYPQSHNPKLVGRATRDGWKNEIIPLLDRQKMIDPDTGLPFTDAKLNTALDSVYEGIRTNGLDDVAKRAEQGLTTPGLRGGGTAGKHSTSRFLHFKDADSYFKYNDQFGYGDAGLFDAMMGHISVMSRDIALLQDFGPKPETMMERMKMKARGAGANQQTIKTVEGMFDVLSGRTSALGEVGPIYTALSDVKNLLRSSLLGSAAVSAMGDSFFTAWTAKMNGLPMLGPLGDYFKLINPLDGADRQIARRQAFIASAASGSSLKQSRHLEDIAGNGWTTWMANFTHRAGGLGAMTDSAQQSMVLSTQGFFASAKDAGTTWADLPDAMKAAFARWEMDDVDYNNIMKAQKFVEPDSGADFIRSEDVALIDVETAAKFDMWLTDMSMQASNEPRLLAQAISTGAVLGEARQGTALRMTASSLMMFKSFGVTVMMNHMLPALRHVGTARGMDRLSQIAPLIFGTTMMGAMVIQTRDLMNGKTPRDMSGKDFWTAAMMQGGGFGIFGDFLFSDQSRFGNDILKTLTGPMVGFGADVFKVFKGNFDRALDEGQESKFAADLFQFGKRYMPMTKLWYTRLFMERMMLDQAERAIDPNYDNRMRRIERRNRKEMGQEYWWKPGNALPNS